MYKYSMCDSRQLMIDVDTSYHIIVAEKFVQRPVGQVGFSGVCVREYERIVDQPLTAAAAV